MSLDVFADLTPPPDLSPAALHHSITDFFLPLLSVSSNRTIKYKDFHTLLSRYFQHFTLQLPEMIRAIKRDLHRDPTHSAITWTAYRESHTVGIDKMVREVREWIEGRGMGISGGGKGTKKGKGGKGGKWKGGGKGKIIAKGTKKDNNIPIADPESIISPMNININGVPSDDLLTERPNSANIANHEQLSPHENHNNHNDEKSPSQSSPNLIPQTSNDNISSYSPIPSPSSSPSLSPLPSTPLSSLSLSSSSSPSNPLPADPHDRLSHQIFNRLRRHSLSTPLQDTDVISETQGMMLNEVMEEFFLGPIRKIVMKRILAFKLMPLKMI